MRADDEAAVRARWAALVARKPCAVEGCPRSSDGRHRGMCPRHYSKWYRLNAHRFRGPQRWAAGRRLEGEDE